MTRPRVFRPTLGILLALSASLVGCGGGGSAPPPDGGVPDAAEEDAHTGADAAETPTLALGPLADRVVRRGTSLEPIPLVVTYSGASVLTFALTATSIGTPTPIALLEGTATLAGTGPSPVVVIDADEAVLAGEYLVTITADDGDVTASTSFTLRVNAQPSIDFVPDTGTVAGFAITPFGVGFYDDGAAPETVTFTATSSDTGFLPNEGIVLGAPSASLDGRSGITVTLTPSTGGVGEVDVTLTATDAEGESSSRTFHVSVKAMAESGVELVSRTSTLPATGANGTSTHPAVSGDGRFVVFTSTASDIAGGAASEGDLFVRDRQLGTTARLGIVGRSGGAAITADGRYIAFVSLATALLPGDANGVADVFTYDRLVGTFERVSVSSAEASSDGPSGIDSSLPYVDFVAPAISDDGRFVAFLSDATNLVPDDTNGVTDAFVRDRVAGTTTRISVSTSGAEANGRTTRVTFSADATVVAFASHATNLVDGSTEPNDLSDVYVRAGGMTTRESSTFAGGVGNGASTAPSLSATGRYLAFSSASTNLLAAPEFFGKVDIYVRDRESDTMTRVNLDLEPARAQGNCYDPSISADGSRIAFASDVLFAGATNDLINAILYDASTTTFTFIGESVVGTAPNGGTGYGVRLSSNGTFVAFQSAASNLFPGDVNGAIDVFVQALP